LIKRRFRLAFSPLLGLLTVKLSIAFDARIREGGALSLRRRRFHLHGKAKLDQAADGFGTRHLTVLQGYPSV
jgi:hypothetical protein